MEAAVKNDNRPESSLAAHNAGSIYRDENGAHYETKGASSALSLLRSVGPPERTVDIPLSNEYPSSMGYSWQVIDECYTVPYTDLPRLHREWYEDQSPWNEASRILNAVLRYGGTYKGGPIRFRTGGWVVAHTILAVFGRELSKRHSPEIVRQIASSDWLLALMFDTKWNPGVKLRCQLAGVVDNDGTLVRVCYIRNKSGRSEEIAKFIPDDSLYSLIKEQHLPLISCVSHKTKLEHLESIFTDGLTPGGLSGDRAHINFTPSPPFDERNLAAGRRGQDYGVVIVYNPRAMLEYNLRISQNAILVSDHVIPWSAIDLVYVVPPLSSNEPWVLYDPKLVNCRIQGYTTPSTDNTSWSSKQQDREVPFAQEGSCEWRQCPNCQAVNPKGFTSCRCCHAMFTFNQVDKLSRVALRSGGKLQFPVDPDLPNDGVTNEQAFKRSVGLAVVAAKLQDRADKNLPQRFVRPLDHIWDVVHGLLKFRIKWDKMTFNDQQQAIAEGRSLFCFGKKFVEQTWGYTPLAYHAAEDFLVAKRLILEGEDKAQRILHKKICRRRPCR